MVISIMTAGDIFVRQGRYEGPNVCLSVCLLVCLLITVGKNYWTGFYENFTTNTCTLYTDVSVPKEEQNWLNFGGHPPLDTGIFLKDS